MEIANSVDRMTNLKKESQRSELINLLNRSLPSLFITESISFAYLAGSWARCQQGELSDIDIFISKPDIDKMSKSLGEKWTEDDCELCQQYYGCINCPLAEVYGPCNPGFDIFSDNAFKDVNFSKT